MRANPLAVTSVTRHYIFDFSISNRNRREQRRESRLHYFPLPTSFNCWRSRLNLRTKLPR